MPANLTKEERRTLARLIEAGEEIPGVWRAKLFPEAPHSVEIGKEYRLEYAGKMKREQVLDEWELFDLQTDPDERLNLYNQPAAQTIIPPLKEELNRLQCELKENP